MLPFAEVPSLDRLLWNLNLLCGNVLSASTIRSRFRDFVAVDFWHVTDKPINATWVYAVDAPGFYDLLVSRLTLFGDAS